MKPHVNIFIFLSPFLWGWMAFAIASSDQSSRLKLVIDEKIASPDEKLNTFFSVNSECVTPKDNETKELCAFELGLVFQKSGYFKNIRIFYTGLERSSITQNQWIITAQSAPIISDIAFEGVSNQEQDLLRQFFRAKTGSEFSRSVLERDLQRAKTWYAEKGYLKAQISEKIVLSGSSVSLKIRVEKNQPCLLAEARYSSGFNVLDIINAPVEPGSICDKTTIRESLEKEENRLKSDGYIDAKVSLLGLDYTPDKERAVARILMEKGTKTRLEVINTQKDQSAVDLNILKDGFSNAELAYLSGEEIQRQIVSGYQRLGYARALVSGPERVTENDGNRLLRFEVTPGPQIFLGKITFRGKLPISEDQVLGKLNLKPGFFSTRIPYVEQEILEIPKRLKALLIDESYLDSKIVDPIVTFSAEGSLADVEIILNIGNKHVVHSITQSGLPAGLRNTKSNILNIISVGSSFSPSKLQSYIQDTRVKLVEEGYTYAQVEVADVQYSNSHDDVIRVTLYIKVTPGPLVKIGQILADGELFGKDARVIKESALNTGDIYKPKALERARQRILKHGLYSSVEVAALNREQLDKKNEYVDIVIRTRARPSYQLSLGPGWGSLKGYRFGIDYTKNNVTKEGTRLFSSLTISQEKEQNTSTSTEQLLGRQITAGVVSPFLELGTWVSPFDQSVSATWGALVQPLYNRLFRSIQYEMIWHPLIFDMGLDVSAYFTAENSELIGSNLPVLEALEFGRYLRAREFGLAVTIDTRNNREWPTLGTVTEVSFRGARFGILSDLQYDRYAVETSWFTPLGGRFSFAQGGGVVRIAHIDSKNSDTVTVPGSRRASLNGKAMVRGYPETGVGLGPLIWLKRSPSPKCKNILAPTGASNLIYTKSELRYRTPWLSENVGLALFADTGLSYFWQPEEAAIQRSLNTQSLDQAEVDGCRVTLAALVGNTPIVQTGSGALREYLKSAYASVGLGIRGIIPNFAALSLDWGIPIFDPATHDQTGCMAGSAAQVTDTPPRCVSRIPEAKMLGLIPGALHISLGAHF